MRILLFTDTYRPEINGVAKTLGKLNDYLLENNNQVKVIAPLYNGKNIQESTVLRFFSLPFFPYPELRIALPNLLRLQKELREFRADICHIATPFNIGLTGLNFCKKNNIPIVASYHTHFDRYLKFYNLTFLSNWLWSYMKWFHDSFAKIYVPSKETKEFLLTKGFNNLEIWGRGIDTNLFHPKTTDEQNQSRALNDKLTLLYVGRLAPEKEVDLLLSAYLTLPKEIKGKVRLMIVGDGPSRNELQGKADETVLFTGFKQGEELAHLYRLADIFTFPSSTETFGNVILEAFASKLPVLAVNRGGVVDNIIHGKTGWLVKAQDVEAFRAGIITLVENQLLRAQLANSARHYAEKMSWEKILADLTSSYQEVIDKSQTKRKFA